MAKLFIVAKREYLERVRSRWFVIITLLVPALIAGSLLFPMYMAGRAMASANVGKIVILDATGTGLGAGVADVLVADTATAAAERARPMRPVVRALTADQLPAAEARATREVMTPNSWAGYLVLDDSSLAGKRARYAGRNASSPAEMEKLRTAVSRAVMVVRLRQEGVRPETVASLSKISLRLPAERIDERGRGGSGQSSLFLGVGIGILLLISIVSHGQNVLRGVLEEKTTRVAEVVISSVKPETLLAGKVLGVGAVGLTQQLLWVAISAYLMSQVAPIVVKASGGFAGGGGGAPPLPNLFGGLSAGFFVAVLLFFLVGFVFYAALYAAVGSMVNSEQEAQQAAMPVMLLLMSGWIMVNPVLLKPNGSLAVALSWLPWSSPIIMPIRMGLTAVSWLSVAGSIFVCALSCVVVVWLAARIYRVGMLMYGKRPSLGELARWIRYA